MGEVSAFGIKLPEQTIEVFVCALLPGTIGVGKIDVTMEPLLNSAPVGKLRPPVTGNGLDQL